MSYSNKHRKSVKSLISFRAMNTYLIAHLRPKRMLNPKQLRHHPQKLIHIILPTFPLFPRFLPRCPSLQRKLQRILDLQRRIMQIVFGVVQHLAAVLLAHLVRVCAAVRYISRDLFEAVALVADYLEEG